MKNLTEKLQSLMGKTVMFNTHNYKLLYFETDGDITRVITDKKILKFQNGTLEKFLRDASEVDDTSVALISTQQTGIRKIDELEDVLEDNIKKVQKDAKYIPQAKQINKDVNAIILMARTKIQLLKMAEEKR